MTPRKLLLIIAILAAPLALRAQVPLTGKQRLIQYLASLQQQQGLKSAGISIAVQYADNGETIASLNPSLALAPASTQKLITTSTALLTLGDGFRFKTELQYDGAYDADNGILNGNIYIRGGGDPTLGSEKFESTRIGILLEAIHAFMKEKGINAINGSIIGDESAFELSMAPATWNWGDLGNYYGAGASGLSVMDNLFYLHFASGPNAGDSTFITRTEPSVPGILLWNEVKSGKKYSGDNAYVYGSEYTYLRYVRGTIPPGETDFDVKASLPDPSLFAAHLLDEYLRKNGISISGKPSTVRLLSMEKIPFALRDARTTIGEIKSPPLASIVRQVNVYSNNLFAEHLHKILAYQVYGTGSNYNANEMIRSFWIKRGLETEGLVVSDGSGLSRNNAVSAANLSKILVLMVKEKSFETFYASLPVAGKSGTLSSVGKGTRIEGNLHAKSGSMNRVRSYAGYVKNSAGREIAFAMIFNNFSCDNAAIKAFCEQVMIKASEVE